MEHDADELLARTYEVLTVLRGLVHPNMWGVKETRLYLDIEAHLEKPATGTIRHPVDPKQDLVDRRRKRLHIVPPTVA